MKIQCDACGREEATLFCPADEAALCQTCDLRVHHANKLAGQHSRFSLLHPSFKDAPRCDICQDKRGFLFCQEDRAILCRECDIPIHKVNEHTQRHNRFLLTGLKLSASSSSYSPSSSSSETTNINNMGSIYYSDPSPPPLPPLPPASQEGSISTNQTSEYLIETMPEWHFDEFIDFPNGFCKILDQYLPLLGHEDDERKNNQLRVPQSSSNFFLLHQS